MNEVVDCNLSSVNNYNSYIATNFITPNSTPNISTLALAQHWNRDQFKCFVCKLLLFRDAIDGLLFEARSKREVIGITFCVSYSPAPN